MPSPTFPTDEQLIGLSDPKTFKRGEAYARSGTVEITARSASTIHAVVSGQDDYTVILKLGKHIHRSLCACPVGAFCKHLVATALVARGLPADAIPELEEREPPTAGLRSFLERQSVTRLAGWLEDLARDDPAVERRLRLYESMHSPAGLRKALGRLLRTPRFLDRRASNRFARELGTVISLMADIARSDPAASLSLYEYAITRLFKIYEQSDDSDGNIGLQIGELVKQFFVQIREMRDLSRSAVLLKLQRLDQWSFFTTPAIWDVLSEAERDDYARAVETAYATLPRASPDPNDRYRFAHLGPLDRMEALAQVRGDLVAQIGVISRDLSSGHAYERVITLLASAGREREATQWAERGLKAHPQWRGMRTLLAKRYEISGFPEEALELYWQDFRHGPSPETWIALKRFAASNWPQYRTRALEFVAGGERIDRLGRTDCTLRVRLLMADGDLEAALDLADRHVIHVAELEHLAGRSASGHPPRAAALLRRAIDKVLPNSQPRHYAQLARQIAEVRRLDPGNESDAWVEEIQLRYKARRKFISALESALARSPSHKDPENRP